MSWSYVSALGKWWWRKGGAGWDGQAGRGFSGGAGWTRDGAASLHSHTSHATTGQKPGAGLGKVTLKMFLTAQKSCFSRKYVEVEVRYWTEALVASPRPPWWSQERSQQDTWLQPELLDESPCGGTSCLGSRDAQGGLTLMRCTWRFHPLPQQQVDITDPSLAVAGITTNPSLIMKRSESPNLIELSPNGLYIVFTSLTHFLKVKSYSLCSLSKGWLMYKIR